MIFSTGALSATLLWAQTPIVTWHYDNARTGANTTEVLLTPNNVNYQAFGKVMTQPVDGFIIGHPLYLPSVQFSDGGTGGAFTTSTVATDATGVASVGHTTPAVAGAVAIHATVAGVNGSAVFSVQVMGT
jgi:hypothetical protein